MASPDDSAGARGPLPNHPRVQHSRQGVISRVRSVSPPAGTPHRAGTRFPGGLQLTAGVHRHRASLGRGGLRVNTAFAMVFHPGLEEERALRFSNGSDTSKKSLCARPNSSSGQGAAPSSPPETLDQSSSSSP